MNIIDGSIWRVNTDTMPGNVLHFHQIDEPAPNPDPDPSTLPPGAADYINVLDGFGVVADGVANDLAAINAARNAAFSAGKILYFPKAIYGIADRFYFADGGDAWFEPGATLKLVGQTASGGAVSGPYPSQTKPIHVHNLTIDCSNIPGENGIGFGHVTGAFFYNLTIRNCLHNSTAPLFGGKALQFEGTTALNCQVFGVNIENCSIGIDIGAHAGHQSVHIGIHNVSMRDVDIPIHVNDTGSPAYVDSYDSIEVVINNVHARNCGRISWPGGVPLGGGIICSNRGHRVTVRNMQVVNDGGGYGSTAYGQIGALVRGSIRGLMLENVSLVADAVALFDHNPLQFQYASGDPMFSTVMTDSVRHFGNLDYVVKAPSANHIGQSRMRGIEVGTTAATLAGIMDAGAGTCAAGFLEVIDRDAGSQTTGMRSLASLYTAGNVLSAATLGALMPSRSGVWTPIDASGAGLSLSGSGSWRRDGDFVELFGQVVYPANSNSLPAYIGGFPFQTGNTLSVRSAGFITVSTSPSARRLYPEPSASRTPILSEASAAVSNSTISGATIAFNIRYPVV